MSRLLAVLIVPVALLTAACGSSSSSSHATGATGSTPSSSTAAGSGVTVSAASVGGLGSVLVDSQGHVLYTYAPDKDKAVTCTGSCATVWPPLTISAGQTASASGGVRASMLSSDSGPSGGRVVTYDGWPLYTFTGDTGAGSAGGQALNSSGGLWYVISPAGKVITAKASGGGSSTTSGSSGY